MPERKREPDKQIKDDHEIWFIEFNMGDINVDEKENVLELVTKLDHGFTKVKQRVIDLFQAAIERPDLQIKIWGYSRESNLLDTPENLAVLKQRGWDGETTQNLKHMFYWKLWRAWEDPEPLPTRSWSKFNS